MATEYVMPKLAMAMNEGTINEWLVKQGDKVEEGEPFVTIETEKVSYDCEAPTSGYICISMQVGETVPCESLVGYFCDTPEEANELAAQSNSEQQSASEVSPVAANTVTPDNTAASSTSVRDKQNQSHSTGGRIIASPLAKKIARDNSLDLQDLPGSGPNGRIVKRDVEKALANPVQTLRQNADSEQSLERIRIPIKGTRKTISERMQQSLQQSAQLSSAWESDITDLLVMRKKLLAKEEQFGTRVSVNAMLIKAICYAISCVPIANACKDGDEIVIYNSVNMGIAIAMPGNTEYDSGLMVAVLHNVQKMGLVEIDKQMKTLINRVRNGEASGSDLSGSTITLSSTAGIAPPGMTTTPILNSPNAALVGPSTPIERAVVKDGQIVPRTMLPVSFTFDHCLLDGEPAARFMKALHDALENPELMLA